MADRRVLRSDLRWSAIRRDDFLNHLAATGDIDKSAAMVGVTTISVFALCRQDRAFAEEWARAIALSHMVLETRMLALALAEGKEAARPPALDVAVAMKLLALRREPGPGTGTGAGTGAGAAGRRAPARETATREGTDAVLMRKLAAIEARRAAVTA